MGRTPRQPEEFGKYEIMFEAAKGDVVKKRTALLQKFDLVGVREVMTSLEEKLEDGVCAVLIPTNKVSTDNVETLSAMAKLAGEIRATLPCLSRPAVQLVTLRSLTRLLEQKASRSVSWRFTPKSCEAREGVCRVGVSCHRLRHGPMMFSRWVTFSGC